LKVMQVTQHYPPFIGGVELGVKELSERLVQDGIQVEVICEREPGTETAEVINGVRVHRVKGFRLIRLRYDVARVAPRMLSAAAMNDADVLQVHSYGFFPTFASILSSKPTLIVTHSDPQASIYPLFDLLRAIPLKLCDRIVATTQAEKRHLVQRGAPARRIRVIPNGIALPAQTAPDASPTDGDAVILCVARLDIEHKGQDILLHAMQRVIREVPRARLWIVGTGRDERRLRGLADELAISSYVEFKGLVTEAEKTEMMKSARVFCVCPRTESFGRVYLEAMSYGLPIVTTDVGGVPEVVGDAATLVKPNDADAAASALIKVLTNDSLAAKMRTREMDRVREFELNPIVRSYEALYREMVE